MPKPLTDKQWSLIKEKYGQLIYMIAHRISGDVATASFNDNVQDLYMAAMAAVDGFERQNNGANGTFDEFFGTVGFDKYIKQTLWHLKDNKGKRITKKKKILKETMSLQDENGEEVIQLEVDTNSSAEATTILEDLLSKVSGKSKLVIAELVKDPSIIWGDGKINYRALAQSLDMKEHEVIKLVYGLFGEVDSV